MIDPGDDAAFPLDPWSVVPAEARSGAAEHLAPGVARLVEHYAAPRDAALARDFLIRALPPGRVCLYGAGTATARVLDWLRARPDVEVVGIIDRDAPSLVRFRDLPVMAPADAAAGGCDRVLVAHPVHEMDMAATLREAGLPSDRLFLLYDNPAFAAAALPPHRARIAGTMPQGVRYCIVGTSHLSTIPDGELRRVFPAEETALLFFSPYESFQASTTYPTIDLASSTALLAETLRRLAPAAVVLRTTTHLSFLASFIREILPGIVLLHDVYDFTNLLPGTLLHGWLALSPAQVAISRLAEYRSLQASDLILSKRDGPWWARMLEPATAPYISYFAGVTPELPPLARAAKRAEEPWHLLYAGILLAAKPGEYSGDYNFLPLFEALAATGRCRFDLYNSAHQGDAQDETFRPFMARYAEGPIRYHRRVAYPALHAASAPHHFGWIYREAGGEVSYDAATVIPSRCLGYLNAGLPLILDDRWGYLDELVTRYHAGIVLRDGQAARLPEILDACDLERLRAGAAALFRFFAEHNAAAMARLERFRQDRIPSNRRSPP